MQVRRRWRRGAIGIAAFAWLLAAWPRALAGTVPSPVIAQNAAPDASAALFKRVCGDCHELNAVTGTRRERQQWVDVIDEMYLEGAKGTDEEFADVLTYLLAHYGRVNVNRAPAEDFVDVLGMSKEDAARIVAHRTAQGPFETFDALLEVPGINVEKIRAQRNAIAL
jgi:competence protein ComEA